EPNCDTKVPSVRYSCTTKRQSSTSQRSPDDGSNARPSGHASNGSVVWIAHWVIGVPVASNSSTLSVPVLTTKTFPLSSTAMPAADETPEFGLPSPNASH